MRKKKKWNKYFMAIAVALALTVFAGPASTQAFAYVDTDAVSEESVDEITEETAGATEADEESTDAVIEENMIGDELPDTSGTAFSVPGNGEVLDDVSDDSTKEFFTITTDNGNTFYLVIDRSGTTDNVYLLSMVDEDDLMDFVTSVPTEDVSDSSVQSTAQSTVVLDETAVQTEESPELTAGEEEAEETESGRSFNLTGILLFLVIVVLGCGGAYFYLKVYKPRQQSDNSSSEGMEYDTGFETVNEDEKSEDELTRDDDDYYYDDEDPDA